jgi:hypothetical protein
LRFILSHQRNPVGGQSIDVLVEAEEKEQISRVTVQLDGFTLSDDTLDAPEVSYKQEYPGVGDGGPGKDHVLQVTAYDKDQNPQRASLRWQDTM